MEMTWHLSSVLFFQKERVVCRFLCLPEMHPQHSLWWILGTKKLQQLWKSGACDLERWRWTSLKREGFVIKS